jgi:hypothetical protein
MFVICSARRWQQVLLLPKVWTDGACYHLLSSILQKFELVPVETKGEPAFNNFSFL